MNSKNKFPDGFFEEERPTIPIDQALEDVTPIDWEEQIKYEEKMGYEVDLEVKKFLGIIDKDK